MSITLQINLGPFQPARRRDQGMTLPEMMVAVGVGCLVLAGMAMILMTSTRTFAAMGNYLIMDRTSRNAMDQMSRDIRKSTNMVSFATDKLVFNYRGTTNLVYTYDASTGTLASWKTGDANTNTLLTGCDSLLFTMYKNLPLAGGTNATTTKTNEGKAISVAWKCSKTILGKKLTTEDMQEALIVIRNKPVL